MKKRMNQYTMLAAAVAGLVITGCVKEKSFEPGTAIRFSASASSLETRTVYGLKDNELDPTMQYIDWVEGDGMTILMKYGSDYYHKDYIVSDLSTSEDETAESTAIIEPDSGDSNLDLVWKGLGNHTFYGMYPAGEYDATNNKLTGTIEATQDADEKMPYGYMFTDTPKTKDVAASKNVDEIDLYFNPHFTAFEFELTNNTGAPITLSAFSLTSATKALNGAITYTIPSSGAPTVSHKISSEVLTSEKTITVSNIEVNGNSTKTFVITTLPNGFSANDLTISCTSGGNTRTLTVGTALDANKKHRFTITLPSFEATYTFSVTNPTLVYNPAASPATATATVTSYKTVGSTNTVVPWFVEGYYATAEDAEAGVHALSSYSTTGLLSEAISTGTGSTTGESVSIHYNAATATTLGNFIDENIKNSTFGAKSSSNRYINLANASNLTSDNDTDVIVESANCYIVNGPGYYRIPLIMGNGQSFSSFVNYKGNTVASGAYLKNQGGVPSTAKVIWEDVDGLINGASSSNSWVIPNAISGDWLKFYIDKDHIKQGNAIIAVYDDAATPAIMWSYHIWVTDYVPSNYAHFLGVSSDDITHTNSQSVTYTLPPYDLGMVVDGSSTNTDFYSGSILYARLQQGTPSSPVGQHAVMRIQRPEHSGTITSADLATGHCAYFQWGRKDPVKGDYTTYGLVDNSVNTMTNISSVSGTVGERLVQTIANPGKTISGLMSTNITNNLWDGSITSTNALNSYLDSQYRDRQVTKTMYDPNPAGYYVPPYKAFYPGTSFALPAIRYRNGGNMTSTPTTYHWYSVQAYAECAVAYRNSPSDYYVWKDAGRAAAMPIRPVRDPSFDPTDDGILGSGSGPNINWQN